MFVLMNWKFEAISGVFLTIEAFFFTVQQRDECNAPLCGITTHVHGSGDNEYGCSYCPWCWHNSRGSTQPNEGSLYSLQRDHRCVMLLVCPNHNYEATHKLPCLSSECVVEHFLITIFNLSDKCLIGILCPLTLLIHNDELWKRLLSSHLRYCKADFAVRLYQWCRPSVWTLEQKIVM